MPPVSERPAGRFKFGLMLKEAAKPEAVRTNIPVPPLTSIKFAVPSPIARAKSVTATRTTCAPIAVVACSNAKLPLRVCPANSSVMPVPEIRTNGAAGSVVSTSTTKVPSKNTPGTFTVTTPLKLPAMPVLVMVSSPCPWSMLTNSLVPSPRPKCTLARVTKVMVSAPSERCSKVKSPRKV